LSKKKPSSLEISEAIGIVKSGYPSCADFELLLSLADRTNYLRKFLDGGIVPGCMRLLEEYCETNNIFDHAYGVLCFRTLCLVLQVGMLETINPGILDYVDNLSLPHLEKLDGIGTFMHDISTANTKPPHFGRKFLQDFTWYFPPTERGRSACLPVVGGFAAGDTDFLLSKIYKNTIPCQVVTSTIGIPGFATFLFLTWQQLIFLDAGPEACSALINLTFRYFPIAVPGEHKVLRLIHIWLDQRIACFGVPSRFLPDGQYDMRTATESFTRKLHKPSGDGEPLGLEDALMLTNFLSEGPPPDDHGLIISLLRAIFTRCWVELDGLGARTEIWVGIIRLCGRGLLMISSKFKCDGYVCDLRGTLFPDLDIINLLGRVMLLALKLMKNHDHKDNENTLNSFIEGVDNFLETVIESHKYLFGGAYDDWFIVHNHLRTQYFPLPQHTDTYTKYVNTCVERWSQIMSPELGETNTALCAYPRCVGSLGKMSCKKCMVVWYCSVGCQSAHWSMEESCAHRTTCNESLGLK
ncbi:hypothetical protein BDV93DRAFT_529094, partial [Ceratobasidium sp. AG-I]